MTDTLTPIRATDPGKTPGRGRGPLIALAVAALLILIIGVTTFNVLTGDEGTVVTEPPPATTEAPTTTTTEAAPQSLLGADTPPVDVMLALQARYDAGDMDGADALIRPDSQYFAQNVSAGISAEIWYRNATGIVVERQCAEGTPPELAGAPLIGGVVVTCTETMTSGLQPGTVIGGGTFAAEVLDGWIIDIYIMPDYVGALSEATQPYRTWLEARFPEENLVSGVGLVVDTTEARAMHQELMPIYLIETGPRTAPSLPADTPLLEVVATFSERFAAGDVAGYEAIFHPLTGYQTGQDAYASWFGAVTGMVTEQDCELVEPTQVRCADVVYSGLLPGTIISEHTTVWNGAYGLLWTIEFPDGPPTGFNDTADNPGVAEYRAWVQTNDPGAFDTLFPDGARMALDTQELRDAHTAMVANYLAATGGG